MKKLAHLIAAHGSPSAPAATLNARLGQYVGVARKAAREHHPVSFKIMTTAIETFELFNSVRNDRSLANDNPLIDRAEARFIFDGIVNVLRFLKATEGATFDGKLSAPGVTAAPQSSAPVKPEDDEIPF
jgi:hypothetical protein